MADPTSKERALAELKKTAAAESALARLLQGTDVPSLALRWPGMPPRTCVGAPGTAETAPRDPCQPPQVCAACCDLLMRPLNGQEIVLCHADALMFFQTVKLPVDAVWSASLFEDECQLQLLWRACRDPGDPEKPFARAAEELRTHTTLNDRTELFGAYSDFMLTADPAPGMITPELEREIVQLIKKKDAASLARIGSLVLANWLLSSAVPSSL